MSVKTFSIPVAYIAHRSGTNLIIKTKRTYLSSNHCSCYNTRYKPKHNIRNYLYRCCCW